MISLIKPLLVNITILLSFTFNANLFFPFQTKIPLSIKQKIYYGLLGTFGALFCMFFPMETSGKTYFDFRLIPLIIITFYSGPLSGSIILVGIIAFRYILGGKFFLSAILVAFIAYLMAIVFRQFFLKSTSKLLTSTLMVVSFFTIFISIVFKTVDFLDISFYLAFFLTFYLTFISQIFVIEHLIKINKQFEEMVYLDKLTMIGQLTASIAHEIRNPLSTVRGFIQFLSQDTKDEQLKKFSPLILEELDRTNSIITNYLTVAKPEPFHVAIIPLHQILHDCVQLMTPLATYSNVTIIFINSEPIYVRVDQHHLKQAIMNILKNGIESVDIQGTVRIEVSADYSKNIVTLIIADNGRGMTPEQLKQIGLPFYTTKSKGTGLGSMVTNKIIREMNGQIEYESEINKGSTVTITLPLVKNDKID